MLLIKEIAKLVGQLVSYSVGTRRFGILLLIALIAAVAALSATATTVTPVALYPFI